MEDITFNWFRPTCPLLARRHSGPYLRKMSAISSVRFGTPTRPSGQTPHVLKRADDIAQRFGCNMGVSRRRAELGMPEQYLNYADIRVRLQKMCRKAVSQPVQCRGLFDPGHHCPAVVCLQDKRGAWQT